MNFLEALRELTKESEAQYQQAQENALAIFDRHGIKGLHSILALGLRAKLDRELLDSIESAGDDNVDTDRK
tara:strand:+ start:291 stop:503 length:213 start_codon:yes stop_codon:yes gene_type:complete